VKSDNDLYRALRGKPCDELWRDAQALASLAEPERSRRAAVVRAVGVAFADRADEAGKARARDWLRGLLADPSEKIRRYAAAALPKLGDDRGAEGALLARLPGASSESERRALREALGKVGGRATLDSGAAGAPDVGRLLARAARQDNPGSVDTDALLPAGIDLAFRCRPGLEALLAEELAERLPETRTDTVAPGRVQVRAEGRLRVADLLRPRVAASVALVLGEVRARSAAAAVQPIALRLAGQVGSSVLRAATRGAPRYRIEAPDDLAGADFHRAVADAVRALAPDLLNDARGAPWSLDLLPIAGGVRLELRPRFVPDPRFAYRTGDIPAASHPPLAAAMARLAGRREGDVVWDPFCGSGLELVERASLGGVSLLVGGDLDPAAVAVARANLEAANLAGARSRLLVGDFREHRKVPELTAGTVSLVLTNPPMGRRVPVKDLRGLIGDLFAAAADVLSPGGRLVFPNPVRVAPADDRLRLVSATDVDLGGFTCRLERWDRR